MTHSNTFAIRYANQSNAAWLTKLALVTCAGTLLGRRMFKLSWTSALVPSALLTLVTDRIVMGIAASQLGSNQPTDSSEGCCSLLWRFLESLADQGLLGAEAQASQRSLQQVRGRCEAMESESDRSVQAAQRDYDRSCAWWKIEPLKRAVVNGRQFSQVWSAANRTTPSHRDQQFKGELLSQLQQASQAVSQLLNTPLDQIDQIDPSVDHTLNLLRIDIAKFVMLARSRFEHQQLDAERDADMQEIRNKRASVVWLYASCELVDPDLTASRQQQAEVARSLPEVTDEELQQQFQAFTRQLQKLAQKWTRAREEFKRVWG